MDANLVPGASARERLESSGVPRLALFVTPHGFGHAARSAAVVEALGALVPGLEVELWTSVPEWLFRESLSVPFRYRYLECDVGLVQRSPVEEDLPATVAALERWWAAVEELHLGQVAAALVAERCDLVVCDIAPFGLLAARAAGVPSVLMENFTWDWIYEGMVAAEPRLASWVSRLASRFALADLHLQLEPICRPVAGALAIPPVARSPHQDRDAVRERLGVAPERRLVLVSLGGVAHRLERLGRLFGREDCVFVLPGAADRESWEGNLRRLPHHSPIHHPDLVAAADLVVGKLGYSTVAETVAASTRVLYVPRPGFRESAVLERHVAERLPAQAIAWRELESGEWVERLDALLACPRPPARPASGARRAAEAIAVRLAGAGATSPG